MTMDREKEREMELESAMYTNCLLLGLDPNIIGAGSNSGNPRVGLFRHSNPKLGEQLLYFILSSLRGPVQSAKANSYSDTVLDFDKVWPIFDSAQSRDFRKVVQGIISELESQGALPRSNSRVSSLATCCGPRFVELLWQLSLHALREVHRRTFPADVASNPLPAPLTDVAFSHAATLLPVTKARIALERKQFLKNAETAVQRQALWSNLAHEMTAEFRGLCAEEAYLHQELEKLHDLRNKVKLEGELWDELVSSSSQNAHMVQRATRLWDSLLSRKNASLCLQYPELLLYRISGSSLLAAMDQSSLVPSTNLAPQHLDNEETESSQAAVNKESKSMSECSITCGNEEKFSRVDEKSSRGHPTVDIAEVLRRWTHALQRIHKQSLQLAKANDGDGPDLLRSVHDGGTSSHAESLTETLTEHRQHLDSIQVLINQLKDVAPTLQNSISELTDEVNSLSPDLPLIMKLRANSPIEAQSSGRTLESGNDEVVEMTSRLSSIQLEKVSASPPTLKLPPLFSSTPNSSGKGGNMQKRQSLAQINSIETCKDKNSLEKPPSNSHVDNQPDEDIVFLQNLKRSVREAALSSQSCNLESSQDGRCDDNFEHFFVPLSRIGFSGLGQDNKHDTMKSRQLFTPQAEPSLLQIHAKDIHHANKYSGVADVLNDLDLLGEYDGVNGFLSAVGSKSPVSGAYGSFVDMDESQEQRFLADSYEDLLAPLSDTETALMEH
ncbi:UNVERIFIED_CONTAM: AUGMIN subunit [Sesamum angustifolium]|uniref:AUGMIN subunit n=1 Tax=Sesamum angustifolium TaxID=2727405 RepID=A0AAW2RQR7_9LAMI